MSGRVRAGGILDIDAVMEVMAAAFDPAFGEAWNRAQCLGILALPDVWLTLADPDAGADDDAPPPGFALSRIVLDEAELLLLAVRPEARRGGIGRALVAQVAAEATRRGARRLLLEMRADNPAAALYAGLGFAQIGRRQGYYRGGDGVLRDAVTLARNLD